MNLQAKIGKVKSNSELLCLLGKKHNSVQGEISVTV